VRAPDDAWGVKGLLCDLDTFAIHDGPGIRMTVYLKGCPLSCAWCHSPESQCADPELVFVRDRCALCGGCVAVCPQGAHRLEDGQHTVDRALCRACGRCVEVCAHGALAIKGYPATAGEIIARAVRMLPFFRHSGGGITLTGGEVTLQPEFALAVLRGCRAQGIHTAIETCGACPWPTLERLLAYTDLVLYDLKLMDDATHRHWAGASNRRILENAARLAGRGVQVRVPLIPGVTDTEGNLRAIYAFMHDVGLSEVILLPYNEAAAAKYQWLDRSYPLDGKRQSPEALAHWMDLARGYGLEATIG